MVCLLFWLRFEAETELASDETVISVTLRTGHHTGVEDISEVSLAHQDVDEVPVLGPRVHPGCLQAVFLLE